MTSLPGPAACITALSMSGLPTRRFCFEAFLPSERADKKERQRILDELKRETRTIILYEAPHHLVGTPTDLREALGNRPVSLCRELTKRYESVMRTSLEEAIATLSEEKPKGEWVIVLEGRHPEEIRKEEIRTWEAMSLEEHMEYYISQGQDRKEAMRSVARDRGISRRDVYRQLL